MNDLLIFNNPEFGSIRTVQLNNETYFIGKDVAEALGYGRAAKAIQDHIESEDKDVVPIQDSIGRMQNTPVINESGLYALIFGSKLESAKRFKHWVTSEVLPSIRKHGAYITDTKIEEILSSPDTIITLATQIKEEREKNRELSTTIEKKDLLIGELQPKANYVDRILSAPGTVTTSQIAADYGISARKLNEILHEAKIQRCVGRQWILYKKHMGKGYAKSETVYIKHSNGMPETKMFTKWTQKGRLMINDVLNAQGIYADMDVV